MVAVQPVELSLSLVNQSQDVQRIHISPWGSEFALDGGDRLTVKQVVNDVGYFEVEVSDIGVFFHAWPLVNAVVSAANESFTLDSVALGSQSVAGRATGWPGNSRESARRNEGSAVAGFYITDSRVISEGVLTAQHDEGEYVAGEALWVTAIGSAPALVIHDSHLAIDATSVLIER